MVDCRQNSDPGVTNVPYGASAHWRRWLGIKNRCVAPFTNFSENEVLLDGSRPPNWFAVNEWEATAGMHNLPRRAATVK
jgi:hypothetical protein